MAQARPVHLVFELDRFRVVHRAAVDDALLARAPAPLAAMPPTGPTLLAVRPFKDRPQQTPAPPAAPLCTTLGLRPFTPGP